MKISQEKYNIENSKYVNRYFIYKEDKNDFIGFNNEILILEKEKINSEIKYKNNNIYSFERLLKLSDKEFKYNEKISFIIEISEEKINNDFSKLNNNIPYYFKGKIIEINKNKIILISSEIEKKFISLDISKVEKYNFEEGKIIIIKSAKYNSINDNIINFTSTEFTKIEITEEKNIDDNKVYIKFNFIGNVNNIKISKIIIELSNKQYAEIKINENNQYYMYNSINSDFDLFYFPQRITLVYNNGLNRLFEFFVYKGYLNEVNIFISSIEVCAYEFLYYSLNPKYLPTTVDINAVGKFDNFQTFGNKTRKKITFINIPIQKKEDIVHGNSFLIIKLCNEKGEKSYGTFKLNSIEFKQLKEYIFNSTIDDFLKDIHKDFIDLFNHKNNRENLKEKYLNINNIQRHYIKEELNKNFVEYKIKEERHTFDYFDSIVIWNIFNYIEEMKTNISNLLKYFDTYEKLEKKEIKYVEKRKILTSTFYRSIESEQTFILPEFYFQDELPNEDPYKIAYNLQFSFIDAINESSGLFHIIK